MANTFDPYLEWLRIPRDQRPPNHYQLLGLNRFESDPQVIKTAAYQRMTQLKAFAIGPHSLQSQQLLNEVSSARLCLLNAENKLRYDEAIRNKHSIEVAPKYVRHAASPVEAPKTNDVWKSNQRGTNHEHPSRIEEPRQKAQLSTCTISETPATLSHPPSQRHTASEKRKKFEQNDWTKVINILLVVFVFLLVGLLLMEPWFMSIKNQYTIQAGKCLTIPLTVIGYRPGMRKEKDKKAVGRIINNDTYEWVPGEEDSGKSEEVTIRLWSSSGELYHEIKFTIKVW